MSGKDDIARPYPGIRPFKKSEHAIFYGRRRMVDAVLDLLGERQLVVVHGGSGCGKSSLIKAGVLPRLEQEHRLHGVAWTTTEMRPGGAPLMNLAEACARLIGGQDEDGTPEFDTVRMVRRLLSRGPSALEAVADLIGAREGRNICILIDQFEELFRFTEEFSRSESETFTAVLRGFADTPPPGLHVIVTMRSDFLGDCAQFVGFAELVNDTQYLLPRLDETQMMRAICQPARDFGGDVAPDLAVRMIAESRRMPDALPLIQHCLMYLWSAARRRPPPEDGGPHPYLCLDDYVGLNKTLSARAEAVMARLQAEAPTEVEIAEHLFRAVIAVDAQGRATRRPLRKSTLVKVTGGNREGLEQVLATFADPDTGFLFVSRDDDPIVDIAHEALIRCWDRLNDPEFDHNTRRPRGWLRREQEDERIWRALLVQAETGDTINPEALTERQNWIRQLPGPGWAERHGGGWDVVADLLERSERQRLEDERARQRAIRRNKRERVLLALAAIIFFVMSGAMSLLWFDATRNEEAALVAKTREAERASEAEKARKAEAEARRLAEIEKGKTEDALVKAEAAWAKADDALYALGMAIRERWKATEEAALKDRKMTIPQVYRSALVAMEHLPDTVEEHQSAEEPHPIRSLMPEVFEITEALRNALAGKAPDLVGEPLEGNVVDMVVGPGDRVLAIATNKERIELRDTRTLARLGTIDTDGKEVTRGMTFAPDGRRLYTAAADRKIRVLDVTAGKIVDNWELDQSISDIALSPDGSVLWLATTVGEVIGLSTADWETIFRRKIRNGAIYQIALDPLGKRIATIGSDRRLMMTDPDGETETWPDTTGDIRMIDWSPDGRLIATMSDTGLHILNADTGAIQKSVPVSLSKTRALAFSPDSTSIAFIDGQNTSATVVSVDPAVTVPIMVMALVESSAQRIAWSTGSRRLYAGSTQELVHAVDVPKTPAFAKDAELADIQKYAKQVIPICFSEGERERLNLLVLAVPQWCIDLAKPPYDGKGRIEYGKKLILRGDGKDGEASIADGVRLLLTSSSAGEIARRANAEAASAYLQYASNMVSRGNLEMAAEAAAGLRRVAPETASASLRSMLIDLIGTKGQARLRTRRASAMKLFGAALAIDEGVRDAITDAHISYLALRNSDLALPLLLERMSASSFPTEDDIAANRLLTSLLLTPRELRLGDASVAVRGLAVAGDWPANVAASGSRELRGSREVPFVIFPPGQPGRDIDPGYGDDKVGLVPRRLAFSSDGSRLAASFSSRRNRSDLPSGAIFSMPDAEQVLPLSGGMADAIGIDWSPDDRLIAVGTETGTIRVWNARNGARVHDLAGYRTEIWGVAFDPTSRYLASGAIDGSMVIWDLSDGSMVERLRPHRDRIQSVAWSRETNLVASADRRGRIVLWSLATRKQVLMLETGVSVQSIAFSPDNTEIAAAGRDGISVWRVSDGALSRLLAAPRTWQYSVAWSADGSRLLAGGSDGKVRIWNLDDTGPLRDRIVRRLDDCLDERERARHFLPPEPPEWCKEIAKE